MVVSAFNLHRGGKKKKIIPCIEWLSRGEETTVHGEAGSRSEAVENKAFLCKKIMQNVPCLKCCRYKP